MHHNCEQEMHEFEVTAESGIAGKSLAELGLPSGLLVTMIRHDGKFVPARGNSVIAAGDGVLVMGSRSLLLEMEEKYFKN